MKIKCTKIDMILTQKFNWLETCQRRRKGNPIDDMIHGGLTHEEEED